MFDIPTWFEEENVEPYKDKDNDPNSHYRGGWLIKSHAEVFQIYITQASMNKSKPVYLILMETQKWP